MSKTNLSHHVIQKTKGLNWIQKSEIEILQFDIEDMIRNLDNFSLESSLIFEDAQNPFYNINEFRESIEQYSESFRIDYYPT